MTNQTICAMATAPDGAIGIIRISGPESINCANRIFCSKRKGLALTEAEGYTAHYGSIIDTSNGNEIVDDVIATVFRAPHSYTGEDSIEISCHGSSYIMGRIISLLVKEGCRAAEPGEYTKRAYLNGKLDLTQAEAVADLIASQNHAQHKIAMQQMRGKVSMRLNELRDKLLHMTSLLELELDFSEEDVEFADRQQLMALSREIREEITRLSASFSAGNAIKNGIPVAIIGAPNVGKSTLLNTLLEDDRAIVSDIKGTTRDIIEDTVTIDGMLFRFIDTAGIRHTTDKIEKIGIERSRRAASSADIIILITEPGVPYIDIEPNSAQHIIHVMNKTPEFQAIDGTGVENLKRQLLAAAPDAQSQNVLITNIRHKQSLDAALQDITRAESSLFSNLSGDLIAEDLRQCLHNLSSIIGGEITPDEVLGNIFKHFCIGK